MKNIPKVDELLEVILPDAKVKQDIARILWGEGGDGRVEVDEEWITIPQGCELAITTKAYFKEYYDINFGPFKLQVAIGGVVKQEFGILDAKYCFAMVFYNEESQLITIDFYSEMR